MKKVLSLGAERRGDFPLIKNLVYLDNSSTSQKPTKVITAISDFYTHYNANVHRGIYRVSQEATLAYDQAHETVARFIHAHPEEIIFTSGTTESINLLASALGKNIHSGDEIVLSQMEHHSNLVPWIQLAQEKKAVLKYIPLTTDFRLDLAKAKKIISTKTKIVSVTHMSNVLGTINPVQELATLAHKVGALIVVDAAQSVPHLSVNVKDLNCDFLAFSGHKMCGPTGIGVLYGKKELLERLEPVKYGGGMIKEVTFENATWADLPRKFEAGTPHIAGAIGLAAAINYLETIGMSTIAAHDQVLTSSALQQLRSIPGLKVIGPTTILNRGPVISFTIEGIHPHDLSELLDRQGIAVRAGHHCTMPLHQAVLHLPATTRVSFYFYNTSEEIDRLIAALQQARKVFQ